MEESEIKRLIVLPIVILVAAAIALAGSQGGYTWEGMSIFAIGYVIAFVIQWIAFIPAYLNRTEKFYDLTGSITYITVVLTALLLVPETTTRATILAAIVIIWAFRLGSFLFIRILKAGEDRRFREIKQSWVRFLTAWTIQGLWVSLTLAAALAAITTPYQDNIDVFLVLGLLIWIIGFGIEVIADWQKSRYKADPENDGKFIDVGLWRISRHPNYFGEIVLWIGVAIIALPVLSGWQFVTLISPLFVILLLTKVSGIPMLEDRADDKWGGQEDYEQYKENTPVLIPKLP